VNCDVVTMTRRLLPLLCLLLPPALAVAQDRPLAGVTDRGRAFSGTLRLVGEGPAREVVVEVEVAGLGRRTARRAAPGTGPAPDVRLLERSGGLVSGLGGGAGALEVALVQAGSGLAVSVDERARGAWFRKVSGAASVRHVGLEARGRLGLVALDPARYHAPAQGEAAWMEGPLDRPSVYLGGRADEHELDAGLTWDRVYDASGAATFTDQDGCDGGDPARRFVVKATSIVDGNGRALADDAAAALRPRLRPNFAFRPFWRTTGSAGNQWHQPTVGSADNIYLYPGQRFLLRVEAAGVDRVRLLVRGEESGGPTLDVTFRQEGFGRGAAQAWKRVSSIDQFREVVVDGRRLRRGNEGRDVLPTRSRVTSAAWFEVHLLGPAGARTPLMGRPHTEVRGADSAPVYARVFRRRSFTSAGGEELDIVPTAP
jgi:hypothetical protein